MNLFVYGTLMWPEIMAEVIGRKMDGRPAVLHDVRRFRVKDQVYPSLVTDPGFTVEGVVYTGLSDAELAALDRFEGPEYDRREVTVQCGAERLSAGVYFTSEAGMKLLEPDEWTPEDLPPDNLRCFRSSYKGWRA
jgi:gamma-glutamylcyclotransferase (GGCT)/AIG2-like uncharacterized protein YtfP